GADRRRSGPRDAVSEPGPGHDHDDHRQEREGDHRRDLIVLCRGNRSPGLLATAAVITRAPIKGPRSPGAVRTIRSGSGKRLKKTITKAQVHANAITK